MSKYKKGIVEDIKKEQIFEENQQHLKDKYKMTGEKVVIVEKNNFLKYLYCRNFVHIFSIVG